MPILEPETIRAVLERAVASARRNRLGEPARYIPELANVDLEATSVAVTLCDGTHITAGDYLSHRFTFQSSAKVMLLAALLQERGPVEVFGVVGSEPSGDNFASVARLETHGPLPANPLINAGAIALTGQLNGSTAARIQWVESWAHRLYGSSITIDQRVRESEKSSADRNRAIAHFLRHLKLIDGDVEEVLDVYFALCSLSGGVSEAAHFAAVLAHGGLKPATAERLLSKATVAVVVSLMATCGMYNESGNYLVRTGIPAKSGVSGVILAVVPGVAGIAVSSPRVNEKGGSVRGHMILRELSRRLGWHFALAGANGDSALSAEEEA